MDTLKLQVGSIIEVHGWVMLKNIEGGCRYKVSRITERFGKKVYWFSKPKGKKEIVGHYADDVDGSINEHSQNRIEIVVTATQAH